MTNSLRFSETMAGWFAFDTADPAAGDRAGREAGTALAFHLTIIVDDVDRFIADPDQQARAEGRVVCEALGGELAVERGDFNLFVDVGDHHKQMRYRLTFQDAAGNPLTLLGRKEVVGGGGLRAVWAQTTTLYTSVARGHDVAIGPVPPEDLVGSGILRISVPSFAKQLTTFRVSGGDWRSRLRALRAFMHLFAGDLWQVFRPRSSRRGSAAVSTQGSAGGH